jgi:hypothetical protein
MDTPQTKKSQQNKFKGNPGKELHTGKGTRAIEKRLELATNRATNKTKKI